MTEHRITIEDGTPYRVVNTAEGFRVGTFEACTACPWCEHIAVHAMREPKPAPTQAEMDEWENEHYEHVVQQWGTKKSVRTAYNPPRPVDESIYEVIRICGKCGREWGQR